MKEANMEKIQKLIAGMSAEEKVAQLYGVCLKDLLEDGELSAEKCREYIPFGIGHVSQFASSTPLLPNQLKKLLNDLQNYLQTETSSKIPALVHEECITGVAGQGATITPQMLAMSCSWNPQLVYENAVMTGESMKQYGAQYALSPMMDVITDARWGRAEEGFGEDAYLVACFALAFIKGLQKTGVAATAKHFAGFGEENQDVTHFRNEVLFPFEVAVKEGNVSAIMPGYHTFHGVPCSVCEFLLRDILRGEWKFDGMVVSDYGAVQHVYTQYHNVSSKQQAAIKCLNTGVDVDFPDGASFKELVHALKENKIAMESIDRALTRVLKIKDSTGLLDRTVSDDTPAFDFDSPENRAQALRCAHQSIVLLKNNGVLPLQHKVAKLAVVGPNADSYYSMSGDYTWIGIGEFFHRFKGNRETPKLVTLLEGLQNRMGERCEIRYERGCDWSNQKDYVFSPAIGDERGAQITKEPLEDIPVTDWEKAMEIAKESDVIIAAMGENRYLCGEGCNREDVRLPGDQEAFVRELCDTGKPVVLVIFGGRPMAISEIAQKCAAVVYAWYPGEEGGNALADILSGSVNPSGKLTVTLPEKPADVPVFYQNGTAEKCRYPFGFGMTYTDFSYHNLQAAAEISLDKPYFDASFEIQNTGKCDGTEIAQVYLSSEDGAKKLIGFSRVELKKGESKTVKIRFYLDSFAKYDAEGRLYLKPAVMQLQIGASSADIRLTKQIQFVGEEKSLDERLHFFAETNQ